MRFSSPAADAARRAGISVDYALEETILT